jgi:hypothetical protein
MSEMPSYSKYNPEKNYESFLNYVENFIMLRETEDEKVGREYLKKAMSTLHFIDIYKNLDKFATDKLMALVLIAQEEGIKNDQILNILMDSITLEPTSGFGGENFAFAIPIKKELTVDLNTFKGKIDGKLYSNVYSELKKLVGPKEAERIERKRHDVENNILTFRIPQYYWSAFVDEEKFKDILVQKLEMSETQIEELMKVG